MEKTVMTVKEMIETLRCFNENDLIVLDIKNDDAPCMSIGNAERKGNWIRFKEKEIIMMESYMEDELEEYLNK